MSLTTADRLRSQTIQRWHTVQISMQQSVAAHSHNVGIIAEALAELVEVPMTFEDKYYLLKYAQVHDLPEIIQGDLSSVYKRFLESRVPEFKAVQQEMEDMLVPELVTIRAHFEKKPVLRHISKLADMIEAFTFFSKAKSGDTQHNTVVLEKLRIAILDKVKEGAQQFGWDDDKVVGFSFSLAKPYTTSAIVDFEVSFDNTQRAK